ncbi:peptidylprolyl isomerase [Candidatus Woesearchaeota archaeon]|nr:peptidylprolyl isomerase [Candidatus Woesearchaeota archaeon]
MKVGKQGSKVKVTYKGTFDDGTVFDSSEDKQPLQFTTGEGKVIPGFENNIVGMKQGEKKKFEVTPGEGYGEKNEALVQEIPRKIFPEKMELKKGMVLVMKSPDNRQLMATIKDTTTETVTLDLNHPLAGKKLHFEVEVVEIEG